MIDQSVPTLMKDRPPLVSIIIPAYNEERRLPGSLDKIIQWSRSIDVPIEVLIVENGSQDRTMEIAEAYSCRFPNVRVLRSKKGKGAAVREGIRYARGEFNFICDSDLSMPIEELEKFLSPRLVDYDVIIASREAPGAIRYNEPYFRHFLGRGFNLIVRLLAVPGFRDTQCGFKFFKREAARDIFSCLTIDGWTFDVEALYLARKRGFRVYELPIIWFFSSDSRVNPIKDTWKMFWDVILIRLKDIKGVYKHTCSKHSSTHVSEVG